MGDLSNIFGGNELYRSYFYYCTILVLKMMMLSLITGLKRIAYGIFINPEDTFIHKVKVTRDERVERVRRAHRYDLKNIPIFFVIAFLYCLTEPSVEWATFLFKIFTLSKIVHTFVYAIKPMQPSRMIAHTIGFAITGYMAMNCLFYFM